MMGSLSCPSFNLQPLDSNHEKDSKNVTLFTLQALGHPTCPLVQTVFYTWPERLPVLQLGPISLLISRKNWQLYTGCLLHLDPSQGYAKLSYRFRLLFRTPRDGGRRECIHRRLLHSRQMHYWPADAYWQFRQHSLW